MLPGDAATFQGSPWGSHQSVRDDCPPAAVCPGSALHPPTQHSVPKPSTLSQRLSPSLLSWVIIHYNLLTPPPPSLGCRKGGDSVLGHTCDIPRNPLPASHSPCRTHGTHQGGTMGTSFGDDAQVSAQPRPQEHPLSLPSMTGALQGHSAKGQGEPQAEAF